MNTTYQLTPEQLDEIAALIESEELALTSGHHDPTRGTGGAMDVIVWKATGKIADTHECVHQVITELINRLNDRPDATSETRWEIVEQAGNAVLGTATLPSALVSIAVMGVKTGEHLARNLATIRSDTPLDVMNEFIATTGDWAHSATTGDCAHSATTGDWAHSATTGDCAHSATTGDNTIAASLNGGMVRAGANGTVIAKWNDGTRNRITVGYTGENGIESDTWYQTNEAGQLQPVPDNRTPTIIGLPT